MSDESRRRGRIPRSVWLLGLLWIAVTVGAVIWGIPNEEQDLTDRVSAALEGQPVTAEIVGRDARLAGEVATSTDLDRAVATVRQVRGVRRVEAADVTIAAADNTETPPAVASTPSLSIAIAGAAATISGTVPDQAAADAIMHAARTRWGETNVVDELMVDAGASGAAWLAGSTRAINGLDSIENGTVAVGAEGIRVDGVVASDELRTAIEDSLRSAFGPSIALSNQLQVVTFNEPSFEAELVEDGTVRLRGVLPDQATVDAIAAGAGGVYGSARVDNEMIVGTSIATPDYLAALPAIFGAIDGLSPWRVNVEGGQATITGLAVSDAAIARTVDRLDVALGSSGITLDNQLETDPTAVATVLTELLQGTATFEVASARLSTDAMSLLDSAIVILEDNPATVLIVEGHTDDVGSEQDNLSLSEARARAVVDYLVAGGVDDTRLTAVGYGESQPIADNSTAAGRSENRRIQFVVEQGDS